jgi:hypothetical protein
LVQAIVGNAFGLVGQAVGLVEGAVNGGVLVRTFEGFLFVNPYCVRSNCCAAVSNSFKRGSSILIFSGSSPHEHNSASANIAITVVSGFI